MFNAPTRHLLLLTLTLTSSAWAATGVSVDVSRVELRATPGNSLNHAVTVTHPGKPGEAPLNIEPYLNDFLLPQSGEAKFLPSGSSKNSLGRWLQVTPAKFTLSAGAKQQVRYTVQVPADAKPGLYWGVLFFKSVGGEKPAAPAAKGVSMNYLVDVGQIIYVQVGEPKLDAQLSGVTASVQDGQVVVQATVRNSGSALVRAAGRAIVVNGEGKPLATIPIEESVALPGYTRTFVGKAKTELPAGQYQVMMALQYAENKRFTGQAPLVVK